MTDTQADIHIAVTLEGKTLGFENLDPKSPVRVESNGNLLVPKGSWRIFFEPKHSGAPWTFQHFGAKGPGEPAKGVIRVEEVEPHRICIVDTNEGPPVPAKYIYEMVIQPSPSEPMSVVIEPVIENESGGGGVDSSGD